MIITRTPFRISFAGGGTDFADFYRREYGAVVSTAINKYMYITVNPNFDHTIRARYSRTEVVNRPDDLSNPIIREALKLTGIEHGLDIVSIADIPGGTGLGSSSSFTVGLLNALHAYKSERKSAEELAQEACRLEIDILGKPIGKQDQYIAAYGGFRFFKLHPDGTVETSLISGGREILPGLLLLYLNSTRSADEILGEQKANIPGNISQLHHLKLLALYTKGLLARGASPEDLGAMLHWGWSLKRELARGITNNTIDEYYHQALNAGACGGKVLGAGGGGFMLLCCPPRKRQAVKEALNLREIEFNFEGKGSSIIYDG